MSTTRSMTCIVCPIGCALEVVLDDQGKVVEITGNTCKRGHDYAATECTHPTRTLTSTVRLNGAAGEKFLPVRTDAPIPKEKLFEAIEQINAITAEAPVKMGDVVCEDFVEKGIHLIACKTVARG